MSSDFCNREMDSEYSFFRLKPAEVCFPYIKKEIIPCLNNEEEFEDVIWVGMMYRYLVFYLGISSKELIKLISPKALDDVASEYELYNIEDAIKEIGEKIKS